MANNQYVNKVILGNDTLIDLTGDTITAGYLVEGFTAHSASGAPITGALQIKTPTSGFNNGRFEINLPYGVYSGTLHYETISVPVPSSGTNAITIRVPNGTLTPDTSDDDDWIPITIDVDSSGNSNVTDNTYGPAEVVSW